MQSPVVAYCSILNGSPGEFHNTLLIENIPVLVQPVTHVSKQLKCDNTLIKTVSILFLATKQIIVIQRRVVYWLVYYITVDHFREQ